MTAGELIIFCQDHGIELVPTERGTLKVKGDKTMLTSNLMATMKERKQDILNILIIMDLFEGGIVKDEDGWQWMDIGDCVWNLSPGTYVWKDNRWESKGRKLH